MFLEWKFMKNDVFFTCTTTGGEHRFSRDWKSMISMIVIENIEDFHWKFMIFIEKSGFSSKKYVFYLSLCSKHFAIFIGKKNYDLRRKLTMFIHKSKFSFTKQCFSFAILFTYMEKILWWTHIRYEVECSK